MINGIGVVGWGVGGIEAEAGMLGQPVYFLTPDVVGVELKGKLHEGITATDLVLTVTEMLRKEKVVGKFVEFFGEGTGVARRCPTARRSATWRPNTARRWASSRSTTRPSTTSSATGRTDARDRRVRGVLQGAGPVRHAARRRDRLHEGRDARPRRRSSRRSRDRSARRTASSSATSRRTFTELFSKPVAENGFAQPPDKLASAIDTMPMVAGARRDQRRRSSCRATGSRATSSRWSTTVRRPIASRRAADADRHRQRRRADRRDHVVHQHVEPERAARRRPAREEGGRERA